MADKGGTTMSAALVEALTRENAALKAQVAAQEAAAQAALSLKVGTKGGVSLYGLGRWPVTLYADQWRRLIDHTPKIQAFLRDHAAELKVKGNGNGAA